MPTKLPKEPTNTTEKLKTMDMFKEMMLETKETQMAHMNTSMGNVAMDTTANVVTIILITNPMVNMPKALVNMFFMWNLVNSPAKLEEMLMETNATNIVKTNTVNMPIKPVNTSQTKAAIVDLPELMAKTIPNLVMTKIAMGNLVVNMTTNLAALKKITVMVRQAVMRRNIMGNLVTNIQTINPVATNFHTDLAILMNIHNLKVLTNMHNQMETRIIKRTTLTPMFGRIKAISIAVTMLRKIPVAMLREVKTIPMAVTMWIKAALMKLVTTMGLVTAMELVIMESVTTMDLVTMGPITAMEPVLGMESATAMEIVIME